MKLAWTLALALMLAGCGSDDPSDPDASTQDDMQRQIPDDVREPAVERPDPPLVLPPVSQEEDPCTEAEDAVIEEEVRVDNMIAGARLAPPSSQSFSFELDLEALAPACTHAVEAQITWTNGATAGADLYVGLALGATGPGVVGHDEQQLVLDGEHTEFAVLPIAGNSEAVAAMADGLEVTIYSDWVALSEEGLPVQVLIVQQAVR